MPTSKSSMEVFSGSTAPPPSKQPNPDLLLPPLLSSLAIEGLPPFQQSTFVHETELEMHHYLKEYNNLPSLHSYCRVGLSFSSHMHPRILTRERLLVMSVVHGLGFLLDDLFVDTADDEALRAQYGIESVAVSSPDGSRDLQRWNHLIAVFAQREASSDMSPLIERIMGDVGADMLRLSNREWFDAFVESVVQHLHVSVGSVDDFAGGQSQDLDSYTRMRALNFGGKSIQLLTEFASHTYIPRAIRKKPFMQKLTSLASEHLAFANDIYSYHKESAHEANPRNLITLLMECEGRSFVEAVHAAVGLVNVRARAILDMESAVLEAGNSVMVNHLQDLKQMIAGNVYYGCSNVRYRQCDSVFPDMRDTSGLIDRKLSASFGSFK